MRLIDADDLIERIEDVLSRREHRQVEVPSWLQKIIDELPAAYDVEVWADIKGYEGLYQVSNYGRVKSLARYRKGNADSKVFQEEKVLKQYINNKGYCIVELCLDAKRKRYSVHRLVANAFIANNNNKEQVNHIDEDKQNNYVGNLEWCTCKENVNYGLHNEKISKTKGTKVVCSNDNGYYAEFHSISEAGRVMGIPQQNISRCLSGKTRKAGGYYWSKETIVRKGGVE